MFFATWVAMRQKIPFLLLQQKYKGGCFMTVTQMVQSQQQQRIGEIAQRTQGKPHVNQIGRASCRERVSASV